MLRENVVAVKVKGVQENMNLENCSPLKKMMLSSELSRIGNYVVAGTKIAQDLATTAISICRRRFKISDLILIDVLDEEEEGESGIAFTEEAIYYWEEDENFIAEVRYDSISTADYDDENVIITTTDGKKIELFCGEADDDQKYSRYMYNFIMDIKDTCDEMKKSAI